MIYCVTDELDNIAYHDIIYKMLPNITHNIRCFPPNVSVIEILVENIGGFQSNYIHNICTCYVYM